MDQLFTNILCNGMFQTDTFTNNFYSSFQEPKPQIVISNPPSNSIPDTSPQSTNESPVHNRTDEEKAAEAISDDITDEDKAEAEHREEVQKQVSARIFSGITRIHEMHEARQNALPSIEGCKWQTTNSPHIELLL